MLIGIKILLNLISLTIAIKTRRDKWICAYWVVLVIYWLVNLLN